MNHPTNFIERHPTVVEVQLVGSRTWDKIIYQSWDPPGYVDKWISWRPQLIKKIYGEPPKKKKRGKEEGTKIGTRVGDYWMVCHGLLTHFGSLILLLTLILSHRQNGQGASERLHSVETTLRRVSTRQIYC